MNKKIFRSMLSVCVGLGFICIILVCYILYGYFETIIKNELKTEMNIISEEVENNEYYLQKIAPIGNRITLVASNGTVIYDSKADAEKMENHKNREEIAGALEDGRAYSVRYSDTLSTKTIYYAERLNDGNVLRISAEQSVVALLLKEVVGPFVVILLITIALAALVSGRVSRRILKPINEMDIENRNEDEPYPELAPLVAKIREQNRRIETQIEEMTRKQREFKAITDNMSEGFLLIDNRQEVLSYNKAAIELIGDSHLRESGNAPVTAYELNRSRPFRTAVEEALGGYNSQQMLELGERAFSIIANPVYENTTGEEKGSNGAVIIIIDVTEKEGRERLRREFTSNVSHELKTPLTTIYGVSDMILGGIVKEGDIAKFAGDIKSESARMIALIDDILMLSRLDETDSSEECQFETVDLYDAAAEVLQHLDAKAKERGISLELSGEHVSADVIPSYCSIMINNLCENAIKYNKDGGKVTVTVGQSSSAMTSSNAFIIVKDTGIGIPAEYQDRIFERFFRVDKSHSRSIGGTGLGLSIVKHAAIRMGCRLELTSTEGEGTEIRVIFS
ncbi:MAG: ATP-binding protein [Eubacteriales bacterium]|nr:ATP-binding protein [Eubacteriales bacterium]